MKEAQCFLDMASYHVLYENIHFQLSKASVLLKIGYQCPLSLLNCLVTIVSGRFLSLFLSFKEVQGLCSLLTEWQPVESHLKMHRRHYNPFRKRSLHKTLGTNRTPSWGPNSSSQTYSQRKTLQIIQPTFYFVSGSMLVNISLCQ